MVSINAEQVAYEVSETIRKDKPVNLGKIISKRYSKSTSLKPKLVTTTKSYQRIIEPVVTKWVKERDRLTVEMMSRDLTKLQYKDAVDALDKLTKNIQLLSGGSTENIAIKPLATLQELKDDNNSITRE